MAIKWTPKMMISWAANIILKGIAELTDFNFDLETRKVYVQIQLVGESETIEVWLEDFAIMGDQGSRQLIVQQAKSNRIWLDNLLSRIVGKAWKIPALPQFAAEIELIAELLKAETQQQEENIEELDEENREADS